MPKRIYRAAFELIGVIFVAFVLLAVGGFIQYCNSRPPQTALRSKLVTSETKLVQTHGATLIAIPLEVYSHSGDLVCESTLYLPPVNKEPLGEEP